MVSSGPVHGVNTIIETWLTHNICWKCVVYGKPPTQHLTPRIQHIFESILCMVNLQHNMFYLQHNICCVQVTSRPYIYTWCAASLIFTPIWRIHIIYHVCLFNLHIRLILMCIFTFLCIIISQCALQRHMMKHIELVHHKQGKILYPARKSTNNSTHFLCSLIS